MSEYYMTHTGKELDDAINKVKNGYIDKSKVTHFATGIVNNVTEGQQMTVTGIKDEKTGEVFDVKGLVCFICPTSATNYITLSAKPGIVAFYRDSNLNDGVGIATYNSAYSVRINPGVGTGTQYLTVSGNSFNYKAVPDTMYGLMAAARWRWVAWG